MRYLKNIKLFTCSALFLICSSCNNEPRPFTAKIYLIGNDSSNKSKDSAFLKELPYVMDVKYTSKEAAKKIYMEHGNSDWDKVLDENPLPASYSVIIDANKFSAKDTTALYEAARNNIRDYSEIILPLRYRR